MNRLLRVKLRPQVSEKSTTEKLQKCKVPDNK